MYKQATIKYLIGLKRWSAKIAFIIWILTRGIAPNFSTRIICKYLVGKYKSPEGNVFNLRYGTSDGLIVHPVSEGHSHEWIDRHFGVIDGDSPSGIMIDVGGYIGSFTLRHISKFKKSYIFEPFEGNYLASLENIKLSGAMDKIEIINAAISDRDGIANLSLSLADTHSLLNQGGEEFLPVKTIRLDNWLIQNNIPFQSVRFIKVDVEGAELIVLRGLTKLLKNSAPILLLEANNSSDESKLTEFLNGFSYKQIAKLDHRNFIYKKE